MNDKEKVVLHIVKKLEEEMEEWIGNIETLAKDEESDSG